MGLGLMVPISEGSAFGGHDLRFADMQAVVQAADEVGFDAVWFADHFAAAPLEEGGPPRGVWECLTTVAGLAAATAGRPIQLGTLVACTGFRHPAILVKMAEAIDEISGGRLILGLGAGWHRPEYDMFGLPFDHRASRFAEAIEIVAPLLREGEVDVAGEYYAAPGAFNRPRGPRSATGGPPILVGTNGPWMLRLTARHADAWNTVWHKDAAEVVPRLAAVDAACAEVGRDPATLVRTAGGNVALEGTTGRRPDPITGGTDEIAAAIRGFRDLGLAHFVVGLDPCTPESIARFAPVIAALDAG
jgi:alkanesulfonate monooxygenase SsuD/methylene tetrahydromethanopterin reductase-like flavin-dependent oxidoreductase (luciferase family)